jgi:hypothetical protein
MKSELNDSLNVTLITFINWQEYNQCAVKMSEVVSKVRI